MKKREDNKRRARKRGEKTRGDQTRRCKTRRDENKKSIIVNFSEFVFTPCQVWSYLFCFWKVVFPPFLKSFCSVFFFLLSFFFLCLSLVFFFFWKKKQRKRDGLMQRMSRGRDKWQLNVHGLHSLNNVTARGSDQESFQSRNPIFDAWEKSGSPGKQKKWFVFKFSEIISNFQKSPGIDGLDGVRRDRDEGDKNTFALRSPQRKGFLAEKRRVQQHRRHDTGELPNAHAHPWNWALPGGMLSKAPLRRARRRWTCQASTARCCNPPRRPSLPVSRSNPVTPPAFSSQVVLLVDKEEHLVWWHMETRRPNREQTSWSTDTLLSQHRRHCVAPRQTLLDQTEKLPPPLGHFGGMRTTFWSHFVVHVGAGRAKIPHVVEETELLLRSAVADHLLSLRVDLRYRMPSQSDGIQGADMRTVPSGTGSLQGWKLRLPWPLKMAPKFSRGPPCERSHHHRRVAPKHQWVAEANFITGCRGASRFWQTLSFLSRTAPHARSDHTRGERAFLMQAETDVAMRQSTQFNPHVKNLKFLNFLGKSSSFFTKNILFHRFFFCKRKSQALYRTPFVVVSSCFAKYPSPAFLKVVLWSPFFVEFCFRKCLLSKKKCFLEHFSSSISFWFSSSFFCLKKQTRLQFFNWPLNFEFFCVISARNNPQTNRFLTNIVFYRLYFLNFFGRRYILNKKIVQKLSLEFL